MDNWWYYEGLYNKSDKVMLNHDIITNNLAIRKKNREYKTFRQGLHCIVIDKLTTGGIASNTSHYSYNISTSDGEMLWHIPESFLSPNASSKKGKDEKD